MASRVRRFAALPVLVVAASCLLTACRGTTTTAGRSTVVVTVTPTSHAAPPPTQRTHTGAPVSKPSALPTAAMQKLPGECVDVLPRGDVTTAVGTKLTGPTVFIVGQPDTSISRLGYINCRYGGDPNHDMPDVEIQVSLYTTAAKAASRIPANVGDFEQNGANATKVTVGGRPATVLIGGTRVGYYPSIVMALGNRTVVVSIKPGVLPTDQLSKKLVALGNLAARRTSAP